MLSDILSLVESPITMIASAIIGLYVVYTFFVPQQQVISQEEQPKSDNPQNLKVVVSGISAGLPNQSPVFQEDNLAKLMDGHNCISPISSQLSNELIEKNVVQMIRTPDGKPQNKPVMGPTDTIQLAAMLRPVDLTQYGVPPGVASTMDRAAQVAVAAGFEALRDVGILRGTSTSPSDWQLPEYMQSSTGVLYASSFPALDAALGEVMRFLRSKTLPFSTSEELVEELRHRVRTASTGRSEGDEEQLEEIMRHLEEDEVEEDEEMKNQRSPIKVKSSQQDDDDEEEDMGREETKQNKKSKQQQVKKESSTEETKGNDDFIFDRKFLFRILVLGNAQLAQIIKARGPNMQSNAACAGSTQAISLAQDMLLLGRAKRMVVIAGDSASSESLLPWVGNGFRALGAVSTSSRIEDCALPFDVRRNGIVIGSGGVGIVLETQEAYHERMHIHIQQTTLPHLGPSPDIFLVESLFSNSAFHGAALDKLHIAEEFERFFVELKTKHNITKEEVCRRGVYLSHETGTNASLEASCAFNEVYALQKCFGNELLKDLIVLNTKAFTGHPMGVSFEDVVAIQVLRTSMIPPVPNGTQIDPNLGCPLNLSKGGPAPHVKYALRFAAGFGSQIAIALYAKR